MSDHLSTLDVVVIVGYLAFTFALGLAFAKKASEGTESYFLAGRRLPWYLVGTSMVATTLAADTPLAVTELVREGGLSGAWFGWCAALGIITSTVFFSRLWRRSGVVTDAELVELRYDGKSATVLRLVRAVYLSTVVNCLTLGWVILAMVKIAEVILGIDGRIVLPVLVGLALVYSTASGFWGVVATDALQFAVAMVGTITLCVMTMGEAGGVDIMRERLEAMPGAIDFFPAMDSPMLPFATFAVYLGVQWWASRNADGGEYLGQRLLAARSEKDAQLGMLWYAVCEFVLKLWPLILAALASLILIPMGGSEGVEGQEVYPLMIARYMPSGLKGLLVASLLAAFMSTVDTHLNWGASYWVNDIYRRFLRPGRDDRHYVRASRVAMVLLTLMAAGTSLLLTSVADTWKLLLALGSGQGLVVLLRWYWWRINAWSEISAMIASAIATFVLTGMIEDYALRLVLVVAISTVVWVLVTYVTRPVAAVHLRRFHSRVRPRGGFWGPYAEGDRGSHRPSRDLLSWVLGLVFVYGLTFAVGKLALGYWAEGIALLVAGLVAGFFALRSFRMEEEGT